MPKYEVTFKEVAEYTVEFETKEELNCNEIMMAGRNAAWFDPMDKDRPDWVDDCCTVVLERELIDLKPVTEEAPAV